MFFYQKLNNILVWVYRVQTPINTLSMCSEDPHATRLDQNDFHFCTLVQENLYSVQLPGASGIGCVHMYSYPVEVALTFFYNPN